MGLSEVPESIFFLLLFWLRGCLELLNRKAREIREHIKEDLGECIRQIHTHLRRKIVPALVHLERPRRGELFHRLRGCLELLSRTARAFAGHLKEDLGECIRQIHTHSRRQCPGLRSFGVLQMREVFFFKTKFSLSVTETITALL